MGYYNKYKKYHDKINSLNNQFVGGKFDCQPKNEFKNICQESSTGKYKSKDSCLNECENLYIKDQLIKENLYQETGKFYNFIKELINKEKMTVYIKGGNALGLQVLKMIYDEYKNNDQKFKKYFDEFLKLELIKDWDFAAYTKKEITENDRDMLDKLAKQYQLVPRAKTFILYQTKKPILTDDKPLFEISILDNEKYSSMEIPLTTMKVKVTEYNVKYIFMCAKSFISHKKGQQFDMELLKRMISKISVIINPHQNGFYNDPKNFDKGELNDKLIEYIRNYAKYEKNLPQFLATHLEDPFRMLYRLPEKNIPKTKKIIKLLETTLPHMRYIGWLFDPDFVIEMIELFTKELGNKIEKIYEKDGIDSVDKFLDGVYWSRTEIEYNKLIGEFGKKLLNNILGKLIKQMGKDNIEKLDSKNKFYHLLQFLTKQ